MDDKRVEFIKSGNEYTRSVAPVRRECNPWERHLMGQPFLQDFLPTNGVIPDEAVTNFMACLQDWLVEELRLREIWRP